MSENRSRLKSRVLATIYVVVMIILLWGGICYYGGREEGSKILEEEIK